MKHRLASIPASVFLLAAVACGGAEPAAEPSAATEPAADATAASESTPAPATPRAARPGPREVDVATLDYVQAIPDTSALEAIFSGVEWEQFSAPETMDRGYLFRVCGTFPEPGSEGTDVGAIAAWKISSSAHPNSKPRTFVDVIGFADENALDTAWAQAPQLASSCDSFEAGSFRQPHEPMQVEAPALDGFETFAFRARNTRGVEAFTTVMVRRGALLAQAEVGHYGISLVAGGDVTQPNDGIPTPSQVQAVAEMLAGMIEGLEGQT